MLMSQLFAPTLREVPADAEISSHQLMLRAGMMRRVASGIFTFLPLGQRVIAKVEAIIREEINRKGGQEVGLLLPAGVTGQDTDEVELEGDGARGAAGHHGIGPRVQQ